MAVQVTNRSINRLQELEAAGCAVEDASRFAAHRAVLLRTSMIRGMCKEFHLIVDSLAAHLSRGVGARIELGAVFNPMRETRAGALGREGVASPHLDSVRGDRVSTESRGLRSNYRRNANAIT